MTSIELTTVSYAFGVLLMAINVYAIVRTLMTNRQIVTESWSALGEKLPSSIVRLCGCSSRSGHA